MGLELVDASEGVICMLKAPGWPSHVSLETGVAPTIGASQQNGTFPGLLWL